MHKIAAINLLNAAFLLCITVFLDNAASKISTDESSIENEDKRGGGGTKEIKLQREWGLRKEKNRVSNSRHNRSGKGRKEFETRTM